MELEVLLQEVVTGPYGPNKGPSQPTQPVSKEEVRIQGRGIWTQHVGVSTSPCYFYSFALSSVTSEGININLA
jgi:hypothetical protein